MTLSSPPSNHLMTGVGSQLHSRTVSHFLYQVEGLLRPLCPVSLGILNRAPVGGLVLLHCLEVRSAGGLCRWVVDLCSSATWLPPLSFRRSLLDGHSRARALRVGPRVPSTCRSSLDDTAERASQPSFPVHSQASRGLARASAEDPGRVDSARSTGLPRNVGKTSTRDDKYAMTVARQTQSGGGRRRRGSWWAMLGLNQRPPACEAGALPLS